MRGKQIKTKIKQIVGKKRKKAVMFNLDRIQNHNC